MTEEWRPVVGYEDGYEVSNLGRVRRIKIVGTGVGHNGYHTVALFADGRRVRNVSRHTLVLEAFVGPRPPDNVGCHYDGDRTNDRLDNLRWDTQTGNMADAKRHGTTGRGEKVRGAAHHKTNLTDDDVRCIRAEPYFYGVNLMLSKAFGVHPGTIGNIRRGLMWGHVPQH